MALDGMGVRQNLQQICSVHAIQAVPAARVVRQNLSDDRTVHPVILGAGAHLGAHLGQLVAKPHALELPQAVGVDEHAGTHLGKLTRLLVNRHADPSMNQRVGCSQSANAATHYCYMNLV